MNKLGIALCVLLVCSTINAQFLSGLSSGQAFALGLGLPILARGLFGGGGVGYPIPPPPRPPVFYHQPMMMIHRRKYRHY